MSLTSTERGDPSAAGPDEARVGDAGRGRPAGPVAGVPRRGLAYGGMAVLAIALMVLVPMFFGTFQVNQIGRFVCLAIVAVGIGLAWGRGGMLTMGQGAFFGIGAYVMAMHMLLSDAALRGPDALPSFMVLSGNGELPWFWEPFRSGTVTVLAIVLLPALVAGLLGFSLFKRKVKGAYFAILNQALVAAVAVLLIGQQDTLGGSNGLSGFQSFFGLSLADPLNQQFIYLLACGVLVAMVALAYWTMRSRFGELLVATRDGEERVRFLGYDPAGVKTIAYVAAAMMASVGGALFVPIVGIISPTSIGVAPSIAFVIGVAVGGRGSLFGPVLGALAVAWAESSLAQAFPSGWSYFQGLLLILVIVLLPGGVASLGQRFRRHRADSGKGSTPDPGTDPAEPAHVPAPKGTLT
ncbi:urea ABC transporter permease subunit UrtC [Citricoccus muralis]|uniref:Urea ABC transporter membrane protein n=1 Tax=Citricoccus muralis TaxID=169134 RepID=A0A3D9LET3_9MICC|nr:urea ABC transporter permease subunit UrtC [Citricoccus muralis]REE04184.1 urea ABC transporter membrane protein [Citricoccus muralis]